MCGILGAIGPGSVGDGAFETGLDRLHHRGPDASGFRRFAIPPAAGGGDRDSCLLGAVRLRIVDLSPHGDQPMGDEEGRVWVAFNGELYNHAELRARSIKDHRFRSRTDTECLVHLAEDHREALPGMLPRLRGMFAFAAFDSATGRLMIARDRLGIKPLYMAERPEGGLAFGSEIRAMVAAGLVPGDMDREALKAYLVRGVIPGPRTAFASVREVPPGSYVLWDPTRGIEHGTWWTPEFTGDVSDPVEATALVKQALDDSIGRHLSADHPVGVFLSSGVDSGAIATAGARLGPLQTFTVTFPDVAGDEGAAADEIAAHLGTDHTRVPLTAGDAARQVPDILGDMDQPTHDGVNVWFVSKAAREAGLVVALSGLGGDELFGGYPSFRFVPRLAPFMTGATLVPGGVGRAVAGRAPGSRLSRVLGADVGGLEGAYRATRSVFSPADQIEADPHIAWPKQRARALRGGDAISFMELTRYMADQTLRDADVMSMAHSLEVRVPLLDDEVVAAALRVRADVRLASGKALLVSASGLQQVHAKQPFALPVGRWLSGPLREFAREGLLSEELPFADLVPKALRVRLWETLDSSHWAKPWSIIVLRMWPGANGLSW